MINPKFEVSISINWNAIVNDIQKLVEEDDMCNDQLIDNLIINEDEYINVIIVWGGCANEHEERNTDPCILCMVDYYDDGCGEWWMKLMKN